MQGELQILLKQREMQRYIDYDVAYTVIVFSLECIYCISLSFLFECI